MIILSLKISSILDKEKKPILSLRQERKPSICLQSNPIKTANMFS